MHNVCTLFPPLPNTQCVCMHIHTHNHTHTCTHTCIHWSVHTLCYTHQMCLISLICAHMKSDRLKLQWAFLEWPVNHWCAIIGVLLTTDVLSLVSWICNKAFWHGFSSEIPCKCWWRRWMPRHRTTSAASNPTTSRKHLGWLPFHNHLSLLLFVWVSMGFLSWHSRSFCLLLCLACLPCSCSRFVMEGWMNRWVGGWDLNGWTDWWNSEIWVDGWIF